ncbi:MAG: glucose 1-dehydrogenase [Steroidobacteraceae bacterium]
MQKLLDNKVAIVTGAARGIGRASALTFAREGACVVVSDMDTAGGEETVQLIERAGGKAFFVACDIAYEDQVMQLIDRTLSIFGRLDCAHNNAGLGHGQMPVADIPTSAWERTVDVVLNGTWFCMKHEIPAMLRTGGGSIVNVSSAAGMQAWPLVSGYGAAKAAVAHLGKVATKEYAARGIRVNAVAPGPIATEMVAGAIRQNPALEQHLTAAVPMGRLGTAQEVAELVVWLCSDRASYISGATIPIDGGQVA